MELSEQTTNSSAPGPQFTTCIRNVEVHSSTNTSCKTEMHSTTTRVIKAGESTISSVDFQTAASGSLDMPLETHAATCELQQPPRHRRIRRSEDKQPRDESQHTGSGKIPQTTESSNAPQSLVWYYHPQN